ncbi:DUF4190 domain-containing protein [Streptomyces sp. NPDC006516]|uniref:DUF4190 domain-containing protein n=1 Tax=Streptomyces sp. NPDC006516 TaxID=3154309 RepID=UPI0033AB0ADB
MSDNTPQPGGEGAPRDPWAPPDSRVDLGKQPADAGPPAVHNQPTVTSMPSPDPRGGHIPAPPGSFGPAAPQPGVPAPPMAPNGPGQAGQYGYPDPAAPPSAAYAYPSPAPPPSGAYGYPGYPGYAGQQAWGPAPSNGLGVAAMVLGIIAVAGFCMWGLGIILGILALIFGVIGRGRAKRGEATNGGMALAGIILGSIAIAVSAVFLGFMIWAIANEDSGSEYDYEYDDPYATSLVLGSSR